MKIEMKSRWNKEVLYKTNEESLKEALVKAVKEDAYLRDANLRGANLRGAYLRGAYLEGAYLEGAYLRGAKEYKNSHDFIIELIRRMDKKKITKTEVFIVRHKDGQEYFLTMTPMDKIQGVEVDGVVKEAEDIVNNS